MAPIPEITYDEPLWYVEKNEMKPQDSEEEEEEDLINTK